MENKSGEFGMFFSVLECLFDKIISYFTLELFDGIGS